MIFITGANGFVGQHLCSELAKRSISFKAGTRASYGDILEIDDWSQYIIGCDTVIHLAARVHVMDESQLDPLAAFRKMNVDTTLKLAKNAKSLGCKRFIFISSVKVNGEETGGLPFSAENIPHPHDPYGISKMEAENALLKLHKENVFEVVIIRPPLIYGPGVKANFDKLFWLVKKDLPIPFAKVSNKRSLVSVFNLCDLIILCCNHPKASGQIFLVADSMTYSLNGLINLMGKTLGKHPHQLPIPVGWMKFVATLLGKTSYADRLFGNLHVDIQKTRSLLNWDPPFTFEDTYKKN